MGGRGRSGANHQNWLVPKQLDTVGGSYGGTSARVGGTGRVFADPPLPLE
jgi:hypothetical protein